MSSKDLAGALAQRLASHQITDETIGSLAKAIEETGHLPIDVDICTLGICVDYFIRAEEVTDLFAKLHGMHGPIRVFPKGIIDPDGFLVQVEHELQRGR